MKISNALPKPAALLLCAAVAAPSDAAVIAGPAVRAVVPGAAGSAGIAAGGVLPTTSSFSPSFATLRLPNAALPSVAAAEAVTVRTAAPHAASAGREVVPSALKRFGDGARGERPRAAAEKVREKGKELSAVLDKAGPIAEASSGDAHAAGRAVENLLIGRTDVLHGATRPAVPGTLRTLRPALAPAEPSPSPRPNQAEPARPQTAASGPKAFWKAHHPKIIIAGAGAALVFLSPLTALAVSGTLMILSTMLDRRILQTSRQRDLRTKFAWYTAGVLLGSAASLYLMPGAHELMFYAAAAAQPALAALVLQLNLMFGKNRG